MLQRLHLPHVCMLCEGYVSQWNEQETDLILRHNGLWSLTIIFEGMKTQESII